MGYRLYTKRWSKRWIYPVLILITIFYYSPLFCVYKSSGSFELITDIISPLKESSSISFYENNSCLLYLTSFYQIIDSTEVYYGYFQNINNLPLCALTTPYNNSYINDGNIIFKWTYLDFDDHPQAKFKVYISTNTNFQGEDYGSGEILSNTIQWETNLSLKTTYYWYVKVWDNYWYEYNISTEIWKFIIKDDIAPAAITSLQVSTYSLKGEVKLSWISPGDDNFYGILGSYEDKAQFRIQYSTYQNINWNLENYNIAIDTYNVNPYDLQSIIIQLPQETTYYFRIWTRDEESAGNYSEISYGATIWVRIQPDKITNLTAEAEEFGDVKLSWTSPGDDGLVGNIENGLWKIKWSTYTEVNWEEETSWDDYKNKFQLLISTNTTPYSKHSVSITGLRGAVTYYFRIWVRDEDTQANFPGNWSEISNSTSVCVVKVLGISLSTDTFDFGEVSLSSQAVSQTAITLKNTGNINQTYSIKGSSATSSPYYWTLSEDGTVGFDKFSFYVGFYGILVSTTSFGSEDILTYSYKKCTDTIFSIPGTYTQTGKNVPPQEERSLWLMIKMPTSTTTKQQKNIKITLIAEEEE